MGERVNFNKSKGKKINFKLILIILIVIFVLYILIYGIIKALKKVEDKNNNVQRFRVSEYDSLEQLLDYYSCVYIREKTEDDILKIYVSFDRDLYTGNKSNEGHFQKIITVVAEYKNFQTFELIDSVRGIDILVKCDGEYLTEITINGDNNYYLNKESEINSAKDDIKVVPFTIQSNELKELINNNWSTDIYFGTKESTSDGYNIFFDEGIKYKAVAGSIFNIIYTDKYEGLVAGGLNANSTEKEIKDALGTPSFEKEKLLLGYFGNDSYLFFDLQNKQISVYPIVEMDKEKEDELREIIIDLNNTNDVKSFANSLTDLLDNYDIYEYDENYVRLQYSLLGIKLEISNSSLKNGLYLYQNYKGENDLTNQENVYMKDTDLVFEYEFDRATEEYIRKNEFGYVEEDESNPIIRSEKFCIVSTGKLASTEKGFKGVQVLSLDGEYPDSELERTLVISGYKWFDDYNFIYSVDYDGIYAYNCVNRTSVKLLDKDSKITLNSLKNGKLIYNDTEELVINAN